MPWIGDYLVVVGSILVTVLETTKELMLLSSISCEALFGFVISGFMSLGDV